MAERDLLDGDAAADAMGGFAAAAALAGGAPALYSLDVSDRRRRRRARPTRTPPASSAAAWANPRWIAGQLRHGYRGAQDLAQGLDAVFVLAATTDAVRDADFDRLYGAWIADADTFEALPTPTPRRRGRSWSGSTRPAPRTLDSRRNAMPADELMPRAAE